MEAEHVVEVKLGHTLTCDGLGGGDDVDVLGEAVSEGDEGVETARGEWEAGDQVEGDGLPRLCGDGEGVEKAVRVVWCAYLAGLACGAVSQVGAHGVGEAGPVEVA